MRRAKRALALTTTRATVEEALRRVSADVEAADAERAARQRKLLSALPEHLDLDVLASENMWR